MLNDQVACFILAVNLGHILNDLAYLLPYRGLFDKEISYLYNCLFLNCMVKTTSKEQYIYTNFYSNIHINEQQIFTADGWDKKQLCPLLLKIKIYIRFHKHENNFNNVQHFKRGQFILSKSEIIIKSKNPLQPFAEEDQEENRNRKMKKQFTFKSILGDTFTYKCMEKH